MVEDRILVCHAIRDVDFTRGENCWLQDARGRRWLDLESGSWSAILGHAHPRINRALKEGIDRVIHLNVRYPNRAAEEAAERVLAAVGLPDGKCVFLTSGSEAVEFAVQAVRRLTGRPFLVTLAHSYLGALGSAGRKDPREWILVDPKLSGSGAGPRLPEGTSLDAVGGFVFEPGGGSPDFGRFPPAARVRDLAARVRANGGLVVSNEVTTGLGRTGLWFGFQHYGIRPDVVALGKALGNGYPVSAVVFSQDAARGLEAAGFHHAQSHQNNPLGCAAAREVLDTLRQEGWIERGAETGASFLEGLRRVRDRHPEIRDVRGRGMLLALELDPGCGLDGYGLYERLWERGFISGYYPAGCPYGTGLRFDPALTLEREHLDRFLEELDRALTTDR